MFLNSTPPMLEKKLFRPSAWVQPGSSNHHMPDHCDRGSSIMLSLGEKKCPPKKKLSKQAHSYKLPRLGAFPNHRLAAHTSSQSRTHKKRLQLKSHEFGNSCLEGVTLGSSKGWSPCNYIVLKLKNDPLVLLQRWQKRHQSWC